jgi:hypothetical protein
MRVDQPGQQGRPGEIDHCGAFRRAPARTDRPDGGAVDDHHRIGDQRGTGTIE